MSPEPTKPPTPMEALPSEEAFIDEFSDLGQSPLTPHGRDCVRTILRALAAVVRQQADSRAAALLAERERLREALTKIASFIEGEWSLSMDEPHSAAIARAALHPPAAPAAEGAMLKQGDVTDWKQAALILGESLAANGPDGYYTFSPQEWLDWARAQRRQ